MINGQTEAVARNGGTFDAPAATRLRRPRWRSPQLIFGVLLVLVSVVAGVRVVATANETTPVLVATEDLSPGQPIGAGVVETRQVALDGTAGHYVTGPVGDGYVMVREVKSGELLPKAAVATAAGLAADDEQLRFLTLPVPGSEAPAGLAAGDAVDVWVTPVADDEPELLAAAVTVSGVDTGGALGVAGSQAAVTLAVRGADADLDEVLSRLIAAGRDGRVYLARHP